jgi:hypothetical protein
MFIFDKEIFSVSHFAKIGSFYQLKSNKGHHYNLVKISYKNRQLL